MFSESNKNDQVSREVTITNINHREMSDKLAMVIKWVSKYTNSALIIAFRKIKYYSCVYWLAGGNPRL